MVAVLTGCATNFTPLYGEMTPIEIEEAVEDRIHLAMHKRDVTDELDDMGVDYNFRPSEPQAVIVVFVRPHVAVYTGPNWKKFRARGLLTIHFEDDRVTGADYTRYEAGDHIGITKKLTLTEASR